MINIERLSETVSKRHASLFWPISMSVIIIVTLLYTYYFGANLVVQITWLGVSGSLVWALYMQELVTDAYKKILRETLDLVQGFRGYVVNNTCKEPKKEEDVAEVNSGGC